VQGVDEVGVEELADVGRSATEANVLALRGAPGLLEDGCRFTRLRAARSSRSTPAVVVSGD
jgi:hypothetical protein